MFFWSTLDLERKLRAFCVYYNGSRPSRDIRACATGAILQGGRTVRTRGQSAPGVLLLVLGLLLLVLDLLLLVLGLLLLKLRVLFGLLLFELGLLFDSLMLALGFLPHLLR